MAGKPPDPLKASVRRALFWRVVAGTLLIAVVMALVVYGLERNRIGEAVVAYALHRASIFNDETGRLFDVPGLPDRQVIQSKLEASSGDRPDTPWGRFVLVEVYDLEGELVAAITDREYAQMEGVEKARRPSPPPTATTESTYEVLRVDGLPHLQIQIPLLTSAGRQVGAIDAVFALTPEDIAASRRRVARAVILSTLIVLATTLLLYPVISGLVRRLSTLSSNLLEANLETLQVLGSAIAKRDTDTQAHSFRVTLYAVRLAEAVGLDAGEIQRLIRGAFLHDVGKIAITDNILLKPGKLTDEEYAVMKTHVSHGVDIVERSDWLDSAGDVVRFHHEKFDGSGYLTGLAGEEIPAAARIFAIVDVFDALTSRRPYHEARSLDETLEFLEEARESHFDPQLLDAFRGIAPALYDELAKMEEEGLRAELHAIVHRYFQVGLAELEQE
jgi:putative nucleotidyltransferase with HDIG domain